jgi:hypothetical protein
MARIARESHFTPDEMEIVHVVNRAVRRGCLMGADRFIGKNYDYCTHWIEQRLPKKTTIGSSRRTSAGIQKSKLDQDSTFLVFSPSPYSRVAYTKHSRT